ncbi:MAG: DNA translocase FtsK [Phycisphaerales bacterium]
MAKKSSGKASEPTPPPSALRRIIWTLAAGAWLFTVISLVGYRPADWPGHAVAPQTWPVANWCGPTGAFIAYECYLTLGPGVWVLLAGLLVMLLSSARRSRIEQLPIRIVGFIVMALAASSFIALQLPRSGSMPEGAGGLFAIWFVEILVSRFSYVGSIVVLLAALAVGAMVAIDEIVMAAPGFIAALFRKLASVNWPTPVLVGLPGKLFGRGGHDSSDGTMLRPRPAPGSKTSRDGTSPAIDPDAGGLGGTESFDPDDPDFVPPTERYIASAVAVADEDDEVAEDESHEVVDEDEDIDEIDEEAELQAEAGEEPSASAPERKQLTADELREKIKKLPITFAKPVKTPTPEVAAPVQDFSGYRFPGQDLLIEPEHNFSDEIAALVREQAEVLERALQTYKIDAEVVAIDAGPVITLYEVALAPGTKVAQVSAISSDVARELKAQNIRIVPNTAGKSTVGVEVPNLKKEKVRLKELMAMGGGADKMSLPMFLGKDASGNPLISDLAAMPHMLIAGTTGSGKSVCMNSIIMSFLFTRKPDELKLILVDPKMVEMAQFKDIPHLMCPVVTEMGKAAAILEWAVTKMDERYELLAEAGVRDLDSYNGLSREEQLEMFKPESELEEAKIPKKLPRIVFIIDELADMMMTNKEVENFIVRIAQKARAVGIHLILATQRPQANVVTGLIKSNMPCRVSFKVASGMDSRIVLDSKGAELLLGQGDMLFLSPRTSKLVRAQGTLVDDSEIRKTTKFLREVAAPSFEPQLVQMRSADAPMEETGERDPLFEDAVNIVLETQRGSVSLLQRRLSIGYSRSSRLIEEMAMAGILGTYKGSQAREVAISLEEWEAMKEQMAKDAAMASSANAAEDEALGETSWDGDEETSGGGVPDEMGDEYRG